MTTRARSPALSKLLGSAAVVSAMVAVSTSSVPHEARANDTTRRRNQGVRGFRTAIVHHPREYFDIATRPPSAAD